MMMMMQGNNSARLALRNTASSFQSLVSSERLISWKEMHGDSRRSNDTKWKNALYNFQKVQCFVIFTFSIKGKCDLKLDLVQLWQHGKVTNEDHQSFSIQIPLQTWNCSTLENCCMQRNTCSTETSQLHIQWLHSYWYGKILCFNCRMIKKLYTVIVTLSELVMRSGSHSFIV